MPTAAAQEVVKQYLDQLQALELEANADLFAPEGVMEFPFAPAGTPGRIEGREEIRRLLVAGGERARRMGHQPTGLHHLVTHLTQDPEVVIVEFEAHGQVGAPGNTYRLPFIQVFRVRDGAILSIRDYWTAEGREALNEAAG